MIITPETITLRDGSLLPLVSADCLDPVAFLIYYNALISESYFMGNVPDEGFHSLEEAQNYLQAIADNDHVLSLFSVQGNDIIARADVILHQEVMAQHRAYVSVGVRKPYYHLGIGTAMVEAAMDLAHRHLNISQFELTVYTPNLSAISMYLNMGFEVVGTIPNSAHVPDGTVFKQYILVKQYSEE